MLCSVPLQTGPIVNEANGHTYYLLEASTWTEAEATAMELGGNLVTINDAAEDAWVRDTFGDSNQFGLWTGLNDQQTEGDFVWASGEPVTYTNWASGQPDNYNGEEDFVMLYTDEGGRWADYLDRATTAGRQLQGIVEIPSFVNPANGHTYIKLSPSTWTEAEARSVELGGHLVTINDAAEQEWVFDTFRDNNQFGLWIGLTDRWSEGQFRWTSAQALAYTTWGIEQPDNFNDAEDYAMMLVEDGGAWYDFPDYAFEGGTTGRSLHGIMEYEGIQKRQAGEVIPGTDVIPPGPCINADGWDLQNANFRGRNLRGSSFIKANLSGASFRETNLRFGDLSQAVLSGASFPEANLTGTNLSQADLSGVRFEGAKLVGTDFTDALIADADFSSTTDEGFIEGQMHATKSYQDRHLGSIRLERNDMTGWDFGAQILSGALFKDAILANADFSQADLSGANLQEATLTGADFSQADLSGANLQEATLIDANFSQADLPGVNFRWSNLSGARLTNANLTNSNISGANLSGARLTDANLTNADISNANLSNTTSSGFSAEQLYSTQSYQNRSLNSINLGNNVLAGWDLSEQNLEYANFEAADLQHANLSAAQVRSGFLKDASLSLANLSNADLFNASLLDADFTSAKLDNAILAGASLESANFTDADLTAANLYGASGFAPTESTVTFHMVWPNGGLERLWIRTGEEFVLPREPTFEYGGRIPTATQIPVSGDFMMELGSTLVLGVGSSLKDMDGYWYSEARLQLLPTSNTSLNGALRIAIGNHTWWDDSFSDHLGNPNKYEFDFFDWGQPLDPDNMFDEVEVSAGAWDLSELYTTGVIRRNAPYLRGDGDFNVDGSLTAADIDQLAISLRGGGDRSYDVTSDGILEEADYLHWVEEIAATRLGDANLDRTIDFSDFLGLSQNFGKSGGWAEGDFNADGQIDFADFLILSRNFGWEASDAAAESMTVQSATSNSVLVALASAVENDPINDLANLIDLDRTGLTEMVAGVVERQILAEDHAGD